MVSSMVIDLLFLNLVSSDMTRKVATKNTFLGSQQMQFDYERNIIY